MDLVLWRHAEAHDWVAGCDDMERSLTSRGEKQAAKMSVWLDRHLPEGTRILVGPARRTEQTADQLWCCERWPVLTLGQAGKPEHLLVDSGIPPVRTDRGGPITHHGPGVNSGQKPRKSGGAKKSGTITACLEPGQGRAPAGAANPLRGGRIR